LLALISFFKQTFEQSDLRIYWSELHKIFSISPYGRYLIVDCRFDPPFSNGARDVAMATNFSVIIGQIGLFTYIRSLGIPKRIAISPFWL